MEREQILKVMVPVGGFAVLLVLVGAVIALNSGGPPPSSMAAATGGGDGLPTPDVIVEGADGKPIGPGPMDPSDVSQTVPSLTAPEWKDGPLPGLKIWDVKEGTEGALTQADTVSVHYIGWLTNGSSFDSSLKRGPAQFALSGVVRGWTEGLPGMKTGGIRRLYIPAQFAYGAAGRPGIPPNSDLVFEVKLLRIFRSK